MLLVAPDEMVPSRFDIRREGRSGMDVAARIAELSLAGAYPDLPGPELLPSRLMRACVEVLPVAAAGMSFFSGFRQRIPIGASDDMAVLAERLQFTIGEGPCLAAHVQDRPVIADEEMMARRWPVFHSELIGKTSYRSIVSLPIDGEGFGGDAAIDLYYLEPVPSVGELHLGDIENAIDMVGVLLIANSGLADPAEVEPRWLQGDTGRSRAQVWVAIGMITALLGIGPVDSLAVIRSYAYGHDSTVDDVARQVVDLTLPVETFRS